jgi:tetratricopeptide (TPR) repeat protein
VAVLVLAVTAAPVLASPLDNPTDAKALDHLRLGNRHLDLEHYDEAIEEYEAGALAEPVPIFWLNIGLAHRKAGRYADAVRAYRTFLSKIGDEPDAAEIRAQVEEIIRAMEDAASKPPTEVEPVTETTGTGRGPAVPDDPPAQTGESVSVLTRGRKISLLVGGGGLLAVGAGVVFGLRSSDYEADANALCPDPACADAGRANDLLDRGETYATYANVAYATGAVLALGAAALWFASSPGQRARGQISVTPSLAPDHAGVLVNARF